MRASADSTSVSSASTPSGFFRSMPTERRPRFNTSAGGAAGSPPLTDWARSTRTTSAPMSASIMAAKGPGPMPAISRIRDARQGSAGHGQAAAAERAARPVMASMTVGQ